MPGHSGVAAAERKQPCDRGVPVRDELMMGTQALDAANSVMNDVRRTYAQVAGSSVKSVRGCSRRLSRLGWLTSSRRCLAAEGPSTRKAIAGHRFEIQWAWRAAEIS